MSLPSGVWLYYGNDDHRMDNDIQTLIERVLPDEGARPFNLELVDGEETSLAEVLILARSLPFMAERRVVVVRQPAFLGAGAKNKGHLTKEEEAALLDFCATPNPDGLLILRYATDDAPSAYLKKIIAASTAHQCVQPKGQEILAWLRAQARTLGLTFQPAALALLEEMTPPDNTLALSSELEKLALYMMGKEGPVTEEDVAAIVTPTPQRTIFTLTDAVMEGKTSAALAAYRDCLYLGSKPPQILRQLLDTTRRLLEVQSMLAQGMSQAAIKSELKRHEYYVKKLTGQARRLPTEALSNLFLYLVDCDVRSKSTAGLDMDAFVEEILINSCAAIAIHSNRRSR